MIARKTVLSILSFVCVISNGLVHARQERGFRPLMLKDPETGSELRVYSESWAVIVGIDKYENVQGLDYAVSDALAIKKVLQKFGFDERNVTLLTNQWATRENILRAVGSLYATDEDARVVFFFAGHGHTLDLPNGGEMGFLVPVDGKTKTVSDVNASCISMQNLKDQANLIRAKHALFLVDACYGGLAATGARSLSKEVKGYIKKVTKARARQIITAGGRDERVIERPEWGHSAFTYKLIDALANDLADLDDNGVITAGELAMYLKSSVTAISESRQTPQFRSFTDDEGEFLFILPEQVSSALTQQKDKKQPVITQLQPDQKASVEPLIKKEEESKKKEDKSKPQVELPNVEVRHYPVVIGGYLCVSGLLGPTGATETQANGGAGMPFGPFLGMGAKFRATAGPENIRWVGGLAYNTYVGDGSYFKVTQSQISIELGAEYALKAMKMGSSDLWPYVGGGIQINMYPGARIDSHIGGTITSPDSKTRFGLGLGGGVEYALNDKMNLDLGLGLAFGNIIGKGADNSKDILIASDASKSGTATVTEGTYTTLGVRIGINYALK